MQFFWGELSFKRAPFDIWTVWYGLGFWQCKLRYFNQEQVLKVAREYKRRNIPIDVIVIDYYHWPRCGDWRFDEEYFPNPKAMVDELHEMCIETMVSI